MIIHNITYVNALKRVTQRGIQRDLERMSKQWKNGTNIMKIKESKRKNKMLKCGKKLLEKRPKRKFI